MKSYSTSVKTHRDQKSFSQRAVTLRYPGGLRHPDSLRFWELRLQTPVPLNAVMAAAWRLSLSGGGRDSGRPKQWPVTSPVLGGCDSSRLGLRIPIWLAEAATAADFKGGSGEA